MTDLKKTRGRAPKKYDEKPTPLREWLRKATVEEQNEMASRAGTTRGYLYQLAGCSRGARIGATVAFAIEDACESMHVASAGRLPRLTARQLAGMCEVAILENA